MKISIFGLGYVGVVSCGCLAKLGHQIVGVDIKPEKVQAVNNGVSPVAEPGVSELIKESIERGNLVATTNHELAMMESEVAIICVGTPSNDIGEIDASAIEQLCVMMGRQLSEHPAQMFTVINRSTCTVDIHRKLCDILIRESGRVEGESLNYVVHPEFLREGNGIKDFQEPSRIIFGCRSEESVRDILVRLYPGFSAPMFFVSPECASMIKYADNCFHAVKVTFANEIGLLCKKLGIDAREVMELVCLDKKLNISPKYLKPGTPFGGSCLPKDLRAILNVARKEAVDIPMLASTLESNRLQTEKIVNLIRSEGRVPIAFVGLTFKENTDDVRESPIVRIAEQLIGKGHHIMIYDENLSVSELIGSNREFAFSAIPHLTELLADDLPSAIDGADVIVISHRLNDTVWERIRFRDNQRIIDLVGIELLKSHPRYVGLYW